MNIHDEDELYARFKDAMKRAGENGYDLSIEDAEQIAIDLLYADSDWEGMDFEIVKQLANRWLGEVNRG